MRKNLVVLTLVAVIALTTAVPALAANGPNDKPFFTLVGFVKEVNGNSITVTVYHGNRFAKEHIGANLTVYVTDNTVYQRWTPFGCIPAVFADVKVGHSVSIHGMVEDDVFTADRVTVDVPLDCCTP